MPKSRSLKESMGYAYDMLKDNPDNPDGGSKLYGLIKAKALGGLGAVASRVVNGKTLNTEEAIDNAPWNEKKK